LNAGHTSIEHTAINIISLLLKEDMSWLKDEQSKINFSRFLGTQYTRTNRNHSILSGKLSSLPERKEQLNPEKLAKVFALLMGDTIGNWIYSLGQFTLIKNNTSLDFITGDQPVFNLDMNDGQELEPPKDFKLYYPLAPNLALLVSKEIQINKEVSIKEVEKYNDFIVLSSYEQIYSQQKESLAKYDK